MVLDKQLPLFELLCRFNHIDLTPLILTFFPISNPKGEGGGALTQSTIYNLTGNLHYLFNLK